MTVFKRTVFLLACCLLMAGSCNKGEGIPEFNQTCIVTQHHERPVGNIAVYIRYDNPIFPGFHDLSVFDTMMVTDANGHLCITNMPEGKSWLVGFGIDEAIQDSVKGSVSIFIEHPKQNVDTIMYVTEIH